MSQYRSLLRLLVCIASVSSVHLRLFCHRIVTLPQIGHTWITQLVGRLPPRIALRTCGSRLPEPPVGWAREVSHRRIGYTRPVSRWTLVLFL